MRDRILRSAGKLRSSSGSNIWLNDVLIQPDRSKNERNLRRSLVEQLKENRKSGERWIIQGDMIVKKAISNTVDERLNKPSNFHPQQ